MNRRNLLKTGLTIAESSLLSTNTSAKTPKPLPLNAALGRRMLGKLEVSSIGLDVQNMSRTCKTTIPSRPEMHKIIRAAFNNGVTLFRCH